MIKQLLIFGILFLFSLAAFSQPKKASSAVNGTVKVYTDNGYYVKASNTGSKAYKFSFKYETIGYTISSAAWAKYPVYTQVSTTTDDYKNVTIEANEERNLFTAPTDPNKKIEYCIKIIEVYNVEPVSK